MSGGSLAADLAGLAWRNVWRNRRRTTLNVIALSVGMGILVLALGWIGGYHTYIYETMRDFQTGEMQVMHADWYAERSRLPTDLLVADYSGVRDALLDLPELRDAAVTGRVLFSARLSTGSRSWRSMVTAIDPAHEPAVGVLGDYVSSGRSPAELAASGERGLWIGADVAETAGVAVGDTLFLRAVNRHGVENLYDAAVAGIFSYGYPALDDGMVYLDLDTATELLDLDGGVTHVVLRLEGGDAAVPAAMEEAARLLGAAGPDADARALEIRPWEDFARAAVSAVEQDTGSFMIMIGIMYLLIVLGILNSMSMSVHERTREIGTVRAIGMRARSLQGMFALESLWQALIAAAVALLLTAPLAWWLAGTGVDIASSVPDSVPIPFGERFRADFAVRHYLFTLASGLLTALAGAILPARRAARISVADAMRRVG